MIKNGKMKVAKAFLICIVLMATLLSYNSYAATLQESYVEHEPLSEGEITANNLFSFWNLLCIEHGKHIPSENNVQHATDGKNSVLTSKLGDNADTYRILTGRNYKSETVAYYAKITSKICKPDMAYILNFGAENVGDYPTEVQNAVWATSENRGNKVTPNQLFLAASAYKDFVSKIAKDVDDTSTYETLTHTYEDGKTVSIQFPQIDREKLNNSFSFDTSNMTVSFNEQTQKYLAGPATLTYVESSYNDIDFGSISGFDIYTDASPEKLPNDKWRLVYPNEHQGTYPSSGDSFYIEIDYIPNATKLTGIDVDYKYLIAGGEFQVLEGTYDKYKWTCTRKGIESSKDKNGKYTAWSYDLQAKKQGLALDSQTLAAINKAARWYETTKISIKQKESTLKIQKRALDENGNELSAEQIKNLFGEDQYFKFHVKVTYGNGKVEDNVVDVKAGAVTTVGTYTWSDRESAPTYEVTEMESSSPHWQIKSIANGSGTLNENATVTADAVNQLGNPNKNTIELTKTISDVADADEEFQFQVVVTMPDGTKDSSIATILVPQGQTTGNTWSKEYTWYGNRVPSYEIIEIETEASKKYHPIIDPSKGYLDGKGATVKVNAWNNVPEREDKKGYLTIEKDLQSGQVTNDVFTFHVRVEGVKNAPDGVMDFMVTLKAGEKAGPYELIWGANDPAPTFTVTEENSNQVNGVTMEVTGADNINKSDSQVSGTIKPSDSNEVAHVDFKFTNDMKKHSGNIKVIKNFFSTEKMTSDELKELANELNVGFDVEVTLKGTFVYNGETVQNSTKVITQTLSKDNNWEFTVGEIAWYGADVPTYTVKEIRLPDRWEFRSITYSSTESDGSEGYYLVDGGTAEVTIVNEIPSDTQIDLTFEMAGIVWVDETLDEKNDLNGDGYFKAPNGVYDEGETLKENAEVTVYKVIYDASGNVIERNVATAYRDVQNNEISFPIITKSDGKWDVPRIQVPGLTEEQKNAGCRADYDVEFVYDGQTYEPTEFLSYKVSNREKEGYQAEYDNYYAKKNEGSIEQRAYEYKNMTTAGKKDYERDSMAIEVSNNSRNIAEVSGKTEINSNGETTGVGTMADGSQIELNYVSDNAGTGYPTQSRLKTTSHDGRVLDAFRATATTAAGTLTFPFDVDGYDGSSLTEINKTIDDAGFHTTYKFIAVYNYCLHINLGLKPREDMDIALTKNLDNAKVVVNEKMYQYQYSGYYDLTEQKLSSLNKDIFVGNHGEEISYTLGLYKSDYYYRAEMYKNGQDASVYDKLENFYATLNGNKSLTDTELDIYLTYKIKLQNASGSYDVQINSLDDYYDNSFTLVRAEETKYLKTQTVGGSESDVNAQVVVANPSDYADKWNTVKTGILGSDLDGNGKNIVYNKMTAGDLGIILAPGETKELTLTFKVNKEKDSEFGIENSIKLGQKCNVAEIGSYTTYEAGTRNYAGRIDRDSAPANVNLSNYNTKPWYEDDTFAAPRIKINLVSENADRMIDGVVWEDNSKDKNTENPGYNTQVGNGIKDTDEKQIEGLRTELVQKVTVGNGDGTYTEYDYIWPTDQALDCLNGKTLQEVSGLESIVQTDGNGEYHFQNVIAGDYVVRFKFGDKKIESADYSEAKYYTGQDYKSTRFKADLKEGTLLRADSYLDIDKLNAYSENKNTAVDNEVRRLQVIDKSREMTYENSSVMADAENNKLFEEYWMFADTPKLDMNIELSNFGNEGYTYRVNHVDFGLEERPITRLTLDKQIEEIILTTSDGHNIMDAKYTIDYEVAEDGKITAKVELDKANSYGVDNLQSLNRDEATNNGFRYISVDSSILEGTTITVKYKFTVFNTGEVDRTGKLATIDYKDEKALTDISNQLSDKLAVYTMEGNRLKNETSFGEYVGNIYYYGVDCDTNQDAVVTSTVRQLIDYVDNDVVFSSLTNASEDNSWRNISTRELKNLIDPSILDENGAIVDNDGVAYETENRNNLAVSVDSIDGSLNNKGFIVALQPYAADQNHYQASMYLTVSKYVGSDSDDLQIDNLAEIIKFNNQVGRRDSSSIVGNQNPSKSLVKDVSLATDSSLSAGMQYEKDTSATEMITMSPPFGSGLMVWKMQIIGMITVGLVIVAGGIVLIKKKVLK